MDSRRIFSKNLSAFQKNNADKSDSKNELAIEMPSNDPLDQARSALCTTLGEINQKLKEKKSEALPFIQKYINVAKTIQDLMEIHTHLNWDTEFSFLKEHRHKKFDAVFKKKSDQTETRQVEASKTWMKILAKILNKNTEFILSNTSNLANKQDQALSFSLLKSLKDTLKKPEDAELLKMQERFFTLLKEDLYFLDILTKYRNHQLHSLTYFIALQNVYYLLEDGLQSHDPLLDPLRVILAISYDQKLKESNEKIDKLIYSNSYKQIRICIHQTKNIDELKRVTTYLGRDDFQLLGNKARWKDVNLVIQKQAQTLGVASEMDNFLTNLNKPVKPAAIACKI